MNIRVCITEQCEDERSEPNGQRPEAIEKLRIDFNIFYIQKQMCIEPDGKVILPKNCASLYPIRENYNDLPPTDEDIDDLPPLVHDPHPIDEDIEENLPVGRPQLMYVGNMRPINWDQDQWNENPPVGWDVAQ